MTEPQDLLVRNQAWAEGKRKSSSGLFERLAKQQTPEFLWIGCSDSRVPPTEICGLEPGELFVHRNIANVVVHTDMSLLSVLQYSVEVLKVKHVIVCGHYGCGGVRAALQDVPHGLIDNWLRNISDVYRQHRAELQSSGLDDEARTNRMCELNVRAQVANLAHSSVAQDAWAKGTRLSIHGWIYALGTGQLKDLEYTVNSRQELDKLLA